MEVDFYLSGEEIIIQVYIVPFPIWKSLGEKLRLLSASLRYSHAGIYWSLPEMGKAPWRRERER